MIRDAQLSLSLTEYIASLFKPMRQQNFKADPAFFSTLRLTRAGLSDYPSQHNSI